MVWEGDGMVREGDGRMWECDGMMWESDGIVKEVDGRGNFFGLVPFCSLLLGTRPQFFFFSSPL